MCYVCYVEKITQSCRIDFQESKRNVSQFKLLWIVENRIGYLIELLTADTNRPMIYKQIVKPVWVYGIQLWQCASESNIEIQTVQRFQNKELSGIADVLSYVRASDLHIQIW